MSLQAFYLAPRDWKEPLTLEGAEANHCHVLRLKPGEEVMVLDGRGRAAICRIMAMDRKTVRLEICSEKTVPPPRAKAVLALALSKAVRRDFFMEKAAELGAWEIWLWQGRQSQGKVEDSTLRSTEARLIAGMKQCRAPWLPELRSFKDIDGVVEAAAAANWRILPWEAQTGVPMIEPERLGQEGVTVYVIGPEGGFAGYELEELKQAGFTAVSFGGRILRCETAATLCLGLHFWASQLPGHPGYKGPEA